MRTIAAAAVIAAVAVTGCGGNDKTSKTSKIERQVKDDYQALLQEQAMTGAGAGGQVKDIKCSIASAVAKGQCTVTIYVSAKDKTIDRTVNVTVADDGTVQY